MSEVSVLHVVSGPAGVSCSKLYIIAAVTPILSAF